MEDDDLGQLRHPSKTLQADIQRMCSMGEQGRSGGEDMQTPRGRRRPSYMLHPPAPKQPEGGAKRSGSGLTDEEKRIIHGECAEKEKR